MFEFNQVRYNRLVNCINTIFTLKGFLVAKQFGKNFVGGNYSVKNIVLKVNRFLRYLIIFINNSAEDFAT